VSELRSHRSFDTDAQVCPCASRTRSMCAGQVRRMPPDPKRFVPEHKSDLACAEAAVAAGSLAVAPVLPELLEWV
jgi:hypothetical protein